MNTLKIIGISEITDSPFCLTEKEFEVLFKKEFPSLCAFCQYKYNFEIDLAKDCVHNGFLRVWENREKITDKAMVKSYLTSIINNICLDILKHEKVKQKHVKTMSYDLHNRSYSIASTFFDAKDLQKDIQKAMNELPSQMRRIFELCKYEELKYAEVAKLLNISVKTVETQMSRALIKLRQKLKFYLPAIIIFIFSCIFYFF